MRCALINDIMGSHKAKRLTTDLFVQLVFDVEYSNTKSIIHLSDFVTIGDVVSAANVKLEVLHDEASLFSLEAIFYISKKRLLTFKDHLVYIKHKKQSPARWRGS